MYMYNVYVYCIPVRAARSLDFEFVSDLALMDLLIRRAAAYGGTWAEKGPLEGRNLSLYRPKLWKMSEPMGIADPAKGAGTGIADRTQPSSPVRNTAWTGSGGTGIERGRDLRLSAQSLIFHDERRSTSLAARRVPASIMDSFSPSTLLWEAWRLRYRSWQVREYVWEADCSSVWARHLAGPRN